MRLNRVLLLAASLSVLIFAMVFTISCSGDDGKNGKNAKCSAANSITGDAITITCDDGTVGTLQGTGPAGPQGPQGIQGPVGPQGPAGPVPAGVCTLKGTAPNPETGNWQITCGGFDIDTQIEGEVTSCSYSYAPGNAFQIVTQCGSAVFYTCGGQYYNPADYECKSQKLDRDAFVTSIGADTARVAYLHLNNCSGVKYDSRTHFCSEESKVEALCGGYKYKPSEKESCVAGKVTKPCGTGGLTYAKATQFCVNNTVLARCGTVDANGVYSTGTSDITGDVVGADGDPIKGEYNPSATATSPEVCENNLVVSKCTLTDGTVVSYEPKKSFCTRGTVAPHCDDRTPYNPLERFCSFVGNPKYTDDNAKDCTVDNKFPCKRYISTPLPFCGAGVSAAQRYNEGRWNWEYCVVKDMGSGIGGSANRILNYSVIGCGQNMIPDGRTTGGSAVFETCRCIPGASTSIGGTSDAYLNGDPNFTSAAYVNARTAGSASNGCLCSPSTDATWLNGKGYSAFVNSNDRPSNVCYTSTAGATSCSALPPGSDPIFSINIGSISSSYRTIIGATNHIANGYPNANQLGTAAVSAIAGGDVGYWFFGGVCGNVETCAGAGGVPGNPAKCANKDECIGRGAYASFTTSWFWDPTQSKCVRDAEDCQDGFGATDRVCDTTDPGCRPSNTTSCKTYTECKAKSGDPIIRTDGTVAYGNGSDDRPSINTGFWDVNQLKNKCVQLPTNCNIYPSASELAKHLCGTNWTTACNSTTPAKPGTVATAGDCLANSGACAIVWGGVISQTNDALCECTSANGYSGVGTAACKTSTTNACEYPKVDEPGNPAAGACLEDATACTTAGGTPTAGKCNCTTTGYTSWGPVLGSSTTTKACVNGDGCLSGTTLNTAGTACE